MYRQSRTLLLLLILTLFPALACNFLSGAASPTAAPATAPPQATQTAAPTEPTSTAVNLVTYEDEALGLSFNYPQSWTVEAEGGLVTIASSPDLLASEQFDREGAGVIFSLSALDEFEDAELTAVLAETIEAFDFNSSEEFVEGPAPTTINGHEAAVAVVEATDEQSAQTMTYRYSAISQAERVLIVAAVTLQEYAQQYDPILETITTSVRLRTGATPTAQAPEGTIEYGETVRGTVTQGQSSSWSFIGVEGETLDISVTPLDEQLDVTVDVMLRSGESIVDGGPIDEAFGTEEVRGLTLPANDEYLVVVRGFAQATGEYELHVIEAGGEGATPNITLDESSSGTVAQDQVSDYSYRHGDEASSVTVVVQPEGELDVVVEIIGPDGEVLAQEDSSFGREQVTFTAEANTEYRIRVRGFAGEAGDFTISLSPGGPTGDDPGTTVTATASLPDNSDSGHDFPFTAGGGDTIYATVQPEAEFDVVVEIWNDDSDELEDRIDLSFGREDVAFAVPATGNYFFKVLGFEGTGGSYTLTMTGPPTVIFELVFGDAVEGRFGGTPAIEYVIRLNGGETLQVQAEPTADTDVVLTVLDLDDAVLVEADDGFSGEPETVSFTAPTEIADGTLYFIRVSDFSGEGAGAFQLSLDEGES